MIASIGASHSPDVDDVWERIPLDDVANPFLLELEIGPAAEPGRDVFFILIGTRGALDAIGGQTKRLVVDEAGPSLRYTSDVIELLEERVASCSGGDWDAVCACLRSFLDWEFSGYREQ